MITLYHYPMSIARPQPTPPRVSPAAALPPEWLDAAGIAVSLLCTIHCAASTVFLAALSLLGLTNALPEWLEWAFLSTSAVLGIAALRHGRRAYAQRLPLRLFVFGIAWLLVVRVTGLSAPWETVAVIIGASCLMAAHALNWFYGRASASCAHGAPQR